MTLAFLVLFLGICVLDSKGKTILQIVEHFAFVILYSIRKQGHSFISYSFICGAYTINILSKLLQMRTISLIKTPFILAARDSADVWGESRILLVTDLRNSTIDAQKLRTSLADRGLADIFDQLVILQRGRDGRFSYSHGSFRALSRVPNR